MSDQELETFKTAIDLRAYAAGQGYQLDGKASWRGSSVMRHPVSDDKVIVRRSLDGHYIYFSVRDDRDNGTIIDFVQNRQRLTLGTVRKELRPWIGQPPVPVPSFPALPKTEKDRMKVEAAYARMEDAVNGHPYLERERALPGALLALDRFAARLRIDARGNAVFPHFDQDGLSGYEIKKLALPASPRAEARRSGCLSNCRTITGWCSRSPQSTGYLTRFCSLIIAPVMRPLAAKLIRSNLS